MSEKINFDYKELHPFKWFILENFPFLEDSIDGLTNYQLLVKLGSEINKNRDSINEIGLNAEALTDGYNSLVDYVDNYFNNLDVHDEINEKLDELVEDGTLTELIGAYCQPRIDYQNAQINEIKNKVDAVSSGSPAGVYATVADLTTANPDHDRIYVVTANNNWYYWNATDEEWASGGLYLSNGVGESDNVIVDLKGKIEENKNQLDYLFSKSIQYKDNTKLQYGKYYSNSSLVLADNSGYTALAIENIPAGTYYYDLRITSALCYIKNIVSGEIKKLSEISVADNPTSETRTLTVNYDFSLYLSMNGNQNSDWIGTSMFANNTLPSKYIYR